MKGMFHTRLKWLLASLVLLVPSTSGQQNVIQSGLQDSEYDVGDLGHLQVILNQEVDEPGTWYKNGSVVQARTNKRLILKAPTSRQLVIYNMQYDDSGFYTLSINGVNTSATVTVGKINILIGLRDEEAEVGQQMSFQTTLSDSGITQGYWTKDGVPLFISVKYGIFILNQIQQLTITSLTLADSGMYAYTIRGETTSANLVVKTKPPLRILRRLQSVTVFPGQTLLLRVTLSEPNVAVGTWYRNRVPVSESENRQIFVNGNFHQLRISNTQAARDDGRYVYIVGQLLTFADIAVRDINIVTNLENVTATVGSNITFTCTLSESGVASGVWQKNGTTLYPGGRISITTQGPNQVLTIRNVEATDAGMYRYSIGGKETSAVLALVNEDIAFTASLVIDASESVTEANFLLMKNLMKSYIIRASNANQESKAGVVVFSDSVTSIPITANVSALTSQIDALTYPGQGTATHLGIDQARESLLQDSTLNPKIMVVVTDGASNGEEQTRRAVQRAKDAGITMLAIGITEFVSSSPLLLRRLDEELTNIATGDSYKFTFPTFSSLNDVVSEALYQRLQGFVAGISITQEMASKTALTGSTVSLTVRVNISEVTLGVWNKNGLPLILGQRYIKSVSGYLQRLDINNTDWGSAGLYSFTIGKRRSSSSVTLIDPVNNVTTYAGAQAVFRTNVAPPGVSGGSWLRGGALLSNSSKYSVTMNEFTDRRSHQLIINAVQVADQGPYSFTLNGVTTQGMLIITALRIIVFLQPQMVTEGSATDLQTTLSLPDIDTGVWRKDGVVISSTQNVRISTEGGTQRLVINETGLDAAGEYSYTINGLVTTAQLTVVPTPKDIAFTASLVIDASESVTEANFLLMKNLMKSYIIRASNANKESKAGVVVFSDSVTSIPITANVSALTSAIDALTYPGQGTATHLGIDQARESLLQDSTLNPKIMVVVTDGASNGEEQTRRAVQRAKDAGITMLAIGITEFVSSSPLLLRRLDEELTNIATSDSYKFTFPTFSSLNDVVSEALYQRLQGFVAGISITQEMASKTALTGSTVSLTVRVNISEVTLGVWSKNGLPLILGQRYIKSVSGYLQRLDINNTDWGSAGLYSFTIGKRRSSASFTLIDPVNNVTTYAGAQTVFRTNVAPPGVSGGSWSRGGVLLSNSSKYSVTMNEFTDRRSHQLIINAVQVADQGPYSFTLNGVTTQGMLIITALRIIVFLQPQMVTEGSATDLQTTLSLPDIDTGVWRKDGVVISSTQNVRISTEGGTQRLVINETGLDAAGEYSYTINGLVTTARVTVVPTPKDIAFTASLVIDASESVTEANFLLMKNLMKSYIIRASNANKESKAGVVVFSDSVTSIPITANVSALTSAIDALTYPGQGTATHLGIDQARESLLQDSMLNPKIMVVVTDGASNDEEQTRRAVQRAKDAGITMLAIGITEFVSSSPLLLRRLDEELTNIATGDSYKFTFPTFSSLNDVVSEALYQRLQGFVAGISITQEMASKTALTGSTVSLTVQVNISEVTLGVWSKNGLPLILGQRYLKSVSGYLQRLDINNADWGSAGLYSFTIGKRRSSSSVTLIDPVNNVTTYAGAQSVFRTNVAPPGVSGGSWSRGGVLLSNSSKYSLTMNEFTDRRSHQLTINAIQVVDQGPYSFTLNGVTTQGMLRITVDGNVTEWSQWVNTTCSASCGPGLRTRSRSRTCTNPAPAFGGRNCTQPLTSIEYINCFNRICPVDGNVSVWTQWVNGTCSTSCGPGVMTRSRFRTCTNPSPAFGGRNCTQQLVAFDVVNCTESNCPVDGGVTEWSQWSGPACDCAAGSTRVLNRSRTCTNPTPANGGRFCTETLNESVTRNCNRSNCPVDGGVSQWNEWVDGQCSQTCGENVFRPRTRNRTCTDPLPINGGLDCQEILTERVNISCNLPNCSIDGNVSIWTQWVNGTCSTSCGSGVMTRSRFRTCTNPSPAFGGRNCTQQLVAFDVVNCTAPNCPVDGNVSVWTQWVNGTCSTSCGPGVMTRSRFRTCTNPSPAFGGRNCTQQLVAFDVVNCTESNCPVDGGVTEWSQWSGPACDCAAGSTRVLNRSRTCTNPTPANGGRFCTETLNESVTRNCNRSNCPVDGGVSQWNEWVDGQCSQTCGENVFRPRTRNRTCTDPLPINGGLDCQEILTERVNISCNLPNCSIDGNVSIWTQWVNGTCSTSCGSGVMTRSRFRTCTNPSPAFGGRNCTQQLVAFDVVNCTAPNCPVDGNVSVWTQWVNGTCSTSCGPGVMTRSRFRTCTNPSPAFGGRNCTQQLVAFDVVNCTESNCPVDGGVTEWSQWSGPACDCAAGSTRVLNRSRTCTNPTPANGGRFCTETLNESVTRNCNRSNCPVDGGVSQWNEWVDGQCSQTCGENVFRPRTRNRTCTDPLPINGGLDCQEILTERVNISCNLPNCSIDGNVSMWTQWVNGTCSTSCGPGVMTRSRFRTCTNPSPAFGGRNCTQQLVAFDVVNCTEPNCPVDGNVSVWTQWVNGTCSTSCGPGVMTRSRFRTCTNPSPAFGGRNCTQQLVAFDVVNCTESNCPVDGGVTEWSQWSGPACDCAAGSTRVLNRSRTCTNPTPANGGRFCTETLNESVTRNCNRSNCPVDGGVSQWNEWVDGQCSQTCGENVFRPRTRNRTCTDPLPINGGLDCQEILTERVNISCNLPNCSIDGNVSVWTQWVNGTCSTSCGPGVMTRSRFRTCTNPSPAFGGRNCTQQLVAFDVVNCTESNCPVDGGVTEWSQWSGPACDCAAGSTRVLNRSRTCTNPTPANGGRFCTETLNESVTRNCNRSNCPVDGGVSQWNEWVDGQCSQTCGENVFRPRTRNRTCTDPLPINGGLDCQEILTERVNISCNLPNCSIDGNVSIWTQWVNGTCSTSCGSGVMTRSRFRTCTNPSPAFGGRNCTQQLVAFDVVNCTESNCPVDGGVTEWSQWSGPACDCAAGSTRVLNRSRTCTNPTPANGGRFCTETLNESVTRNCNRSNCPVDGNVSIWTQWVNGTCSTSCGPGVMTRSRFRTCTNPSPAFGGRNCTQQLVAFDVVNCTEPNCPVDGNVSIWTQWVNGTCSTSCGSGVRTRSRFRTCTNPSPAFGGRNCTQQLVAFDVVNCTEPNCPVDGNVSVWTQWVNGTCSTNCGPGVMTRSRFRTCTNPSPAFGGRNCTQQLVAFDVVNCTESNCPVDGGVTEWSQWSGPACDCAAGSTRVLNRSRTCTNPTPANGGRFCTETLNESVTRNCNRSNCPVDGGVSQWNEWVDGQCSQTCGENVFRPRTRNRTCTDPLPINGGLDCQEILTERVNISCNLPNCSIDGNVSIWTQWVNGTCSTSCGPGVMTRSRFRTCTNPSPAFGGRNCTQQLVAFDVVNCTELNCPVDGNVSIWTQWVNGTCSTSCGSGVRTRSRFRTCTNPSPAFGGRNCTQQLVAFDVVNCTEPNCPVDGNVSVWTQWVNGTCSTSCGPGVMTRSRFRTCTNPSPAFGGRNCTQQLVAFDVVNCTESNCPVDGGVTEWSQWSGPACDCAAGSTRVLNRSRTCTNPTPANGGRFCTETLNESVTRNCNRSNCPFDGGVSQWNEWVDGQCSQTCGENVFRPRTRNRTCTDPLPINGGLDCQEILTERVNISCNLSNCSIDGNVSIWTQWVNGTCSTSCGPGVMTRSRFRTCTNPSPAFGGRNCTQQLVAFDVVNCTESNCPVDGGVTEWSQWSGPACDCAAGSTRVLNRSRTCTNPTPANGGRFCTETLNESVTRNCNRSNCPVDGGVSQWNEWVDGQCSQTCGENVFRPRTRNRTCTDPLPINGGLDCQEILTERVNISCNLPNCSIDGNVSIWTQWVNGTCSTSCGPGVMTRSRFRTCTNPSPAFGGRNCTQQLVAFDVVNCTEPNCPVDGNVSIWTQWVNGTCSTSCGSGVRTRSRFRTCTNPSPAFGGRNCTQQLVAFDVVNCTESNCPVDGNVSIWTQWVNGTCSTSCGPGVRTRSRFRTCTNPSPAFGGRNCTQQLVAFDVVNCTESNCPVDGGVTEWSQWSGPACDCAAGSTRVLNRSRTCTNPTPANGGRFCTETLNESVTRNCNRSNCPVDGGVSQWNEWVDGQCSQTCGENVFRPRTRNRTCTDPLPINGGLDCQEILTERVNISCNLPNCSIDGNVSIWTQWVNGTCSTSCGSGVMTRSRFRTCTNPSPAFGGRNCTQQLVAFDVVNCTEPNCPVDGNVSIWTQWVNGTCSTSCGSGVRTRSRFRTCTNPSPAFGGRNCTQQLVAFDVVNCTEPNCPVDGNVSVWTQWVNGTCSTSCGPGVMTRSRFRTCTNPSPAFGGRNCTQQLVAFDVVNCTESNCPVDGGVTEWSQWSGPACDCAAGSTRVLNRSRTCTNPTPANGGRFCTETLNESVTRNCNRSNCPVDGGVSQWNEWVDGQCSQTCGENVFRPRTRNRTCTDPLPINGGLDCQEILTERVNISCNLPNCSIDGNVSIWTQWVNGTCSTSCGSGVRTRSRFRTCTNPSPAFGGRNCTQQLVAFDVVNCTEPNCPVDGNVSVWTQWVNGTCSTSCGPGVMTRSRFRTCTNPSPAFGGRNCTQQLVAFDVVNCTESNCPVDGGVTEWSQWSGPACDCAAGSTRVLNRSRTCTNPTPANGGRFCTETLNESVTRNCNRSNCPVDGGVSQWNEWVDGQCSQTCGENVFRPRTRNRTCTDPLPINGGLDCQEILTERVNISCNLPNCSIDGNVSIWTQWVNGTCSTSCGSGVMTRSRFRTCTNPSPAFGGRNCTQQLVAFDVVNCTEPNCPVDGNVSIWTQWVNGTCSTSCGSGVRTRSRFRTCTNPSPAFGGRNCTQHLVAFDVVNCTEPNCPVDGNVSVWTQWVNGTCSTSCGPGVMTRSRFRTCTNPSPAFGGRNCTQQLVAFDVVNCTEPNCPVDGNVSIWTQWVNGTCSTSCGSGVRTRSRFRTCTNPSPAFGGRNCTQQLVAFDVVNCTEPNCPVDGNVSIWTQWVNGTCSTSCGSGVRTRSRFRTCTNPSPAFGGRNCTQQLVAFDVVNCTEPNCPVDGNVSIWTQWVNGTCSTSCGSGVRTRSRFRTCTNPSPAFGGRNCTQQLVAFDVVNCTEPNCPVDGNVSVWTQWVNGTCSTSCGPGVMTRSRFRTCTNPSPAFGGRNCTQQLVAFDVVNCTESNCPVDGGVTEWSQWSGPACDCAAGSTRVLNRSRTCTNPTPANGGRFCTETLNESVTRNCNRSNCPVDGGVSQWNEWVDGQCSQTCGENVFRPRTRNRTCTDPLPINGGLDCQEILTERVNISCNLPNCSIDGNVSIWTQWVNGTCSTSCGSGVMTRSRFRTCTNPSPAFGGRNCTQQLVAFDVVNCTEPNCPVDGNVSIWTQWVNGTCSTSCGSGVRTRSRFRTCTNPSPAFGGRNCTQQLVAVDVVNCTGSNCPVDGNVTTWSHWDNSPCSTSCGPGVRVRFRFRTCTNPAPAFGGMKCKEELDSFEIVNCTERNCPVHGGISDWSQWTTVPCNATCGEEETTRAIRTRACTRPTPAFGGRDCVETRIEIARRNCNLSSCPIDGNFTGWSQWSSPPCNVTCGQAATKMVTRVRTCINPQNGSANCVGPTSQNKTVSCGLGPCPMIGVCDDVMMRFGVGYRSHPTECDKYIQCYFHPNGSVVGVYRSCSFGYSWNQATFACVESGKVSCPMASKNCGPTYKMEGSCRSYRKYVQGKLESRCCATGFSFSPVAGCRPNFYCDDVCPSPYFTKDVCDKYPDWNTPQFYNISVGGLGWSSASCPQNSSFDIVDCGCLIKSTDTCDARYMWAFGSATTPSWMTTRDVSTINDVGVFNSSSYVFLNVTMTTSNRTLALKFRFREDAVVNDSRALLSCTDKLVITSTNDGVEFVINNKYGVISKLFIFTNGISRSDWKTVTALYKDRILTGMVETGSVKYISQVFAKDVDIMTDGVNLGSDASSDENTSFIGDISMVSIYDCDPSSTL